MQETKNNKSLNNAITAILDKRGIENKAEFLSPSPKNLSISKQITGIKDTIKAIEKAVEQQKKIIIFGHDDVDGITSTLILDNILREKGIKNLSYYIPNRKTDQHGFNEDFLKKVVYEKFEVVISVDIGIGEWEAVDFFLENEIQTIIIDHHNIPQKLPQALAVTDPKLAGEYCSQNILSAAGVVYHLARLTGDDKTKKINLVLAGLGTLADRVPLIRDNRFFSRFLYDNLNKTNNKFINYFIQQNETLDNLSLIDKLITFLTLGRGEQGRHKGLSLLLETSSEKIKKGYSHLQKIFSDEKKVINKVKKIILSHYKKFKKEKFFFYFDERKEIPVELLGLAASLVSDQYEKPALVLSSLPNQKIIGECRGPYNFNWAKNLSKISKYLINHGGHKRAAGFTTKAEFVDEIKEKLDEIFLNYTPVAPKELKIDYSFSDFHNFKKIQQQIFEKLAPFGKNNSNPIYEIKTIQVGQIAEYICGESNLNIDREIRAIIKFNFEQNCFNLLKFDFV